MKASEVSAQRGAGAPLSSARTPVPLAGGSDCSELQQRPHGVHTLPVYQARTFSSRLRPFAACVLGTEAFLPVHPVTLGSQQDSQAALWALR